MEKVDLTNVSAEDLRKALQAKTKEEQEAREKDRLDYEKERDGLILESITIAEEFQTKIQEFKSTLTDAFIKQEERLKTYGGIRANSKGGFSLVSKDGTMKVTRTRSTKPTWDERSEKAMRLIEDFLKTTVRKRDSKLFDILFSFIQKNDQGELEYSKVMLLLQHQDKYEDPRWKEGLALLKESYSLHFRGFGYSFYKKNDQGKWENIEINFQAI